MSNPIDPSKLLQQAEALAGVRAKAGPPKTIDHRRAVSSAYYALFHEINLTAARNVLPSYAQDEEIWGVTRWVSHADVRSVCDAVIACASARKPVGGLPKGLGQGAVPLWLALSSDADDGMRKADVPVSLLLVAAVFVSLHGARQEADYDHSASFSKATTIDRVSSAKVAIEYLREGANKHEFRRLSAWIVARASGFRTR